MKHSISRHLDPEEFEPEYSRANKNFFTHRGTRRDFEDYQERRERERAKNRKRKMQRRE